MKISEKRILTIAICLLLAVVGIINQYQTLRDGESIFEMEIFDRETSNDE